MHTWLQAEAACVGRLEIAGERVMLFLHLLMLLDAFRLILEQEDRLLNVVTQAHEAERRHRRIFILLVVTLDTGARYRRQINQFLQVQTAIAC